MSLFPEIDTPNVLIDLDIAERNIARFQKWAEGHGLAVRPHIKTHKLPMLAKAQIAAGAVGITCQKVSEAEAMIAEGGIDDVLITYNILGRSKLERLKALAGKVRLTVCADSAATVEGLSRYFADADMPLRVMVECDTGAARCGVQTPAAAADLARLIAHGPGLAFAGLMTYPPVGREAEVEAWLFEAKALAEKAGLAVPCISAGGSPGMWQADAIPTATEWRPGTYVYNDRSLVERGVCGLDDCALTVLATVVSVPTTTRAVVDAGSKVLTSDLLGLTGHGHVLGRPDLAIDQLSEEHGRIVSDAPHGLAVGQRVRIVPNHACVVSNMMDRVVTLRGGRVAGPVAVAARGTVW